MINLLRNAIVRDTHIFLCLIISICTLSFENNAYANDKSTYSVKADTLIHRCDSLLSKLTSHKSELPKTLSEFNSFYSSEIDSILEVNMQLINEAEKLNIELFIVYHYLRNSLKNMGDFQVYSSKLNQLIMASSIINQETSILIFYQNSIENQRVTNISKILSYLSILLALLGVYLTIKSLFFKSKYQTPIKL